MPEGCTAMALRSKNEPLDGEFIVHGFTGADVLESAARIVNGREKGIRKVERMVRIFGEEG